MFRYIFTSCTVVISLLLGSMSFAQSSIQDRLSVSNPRGAGPWPVVILMHWTSGVGAAERRWTGLLNRAGFSVVVLESFARIDGDFAYFETRVPERVAQLKEAYAAVVNQSWSNGEVSVFGRSHGAWAVIDALKAGALGSRLEHAVASAPRCDGPRSAQATFRSQTPLLVIVGSSDQLTSAEACRAFVAAAKSTGAPIDVETYWAGHSVDLDNATARRAIIAFLSQ